MANNFPVPFFTPSPVLTGLAISYKNAEYVADLVCPRVAVAVPTFAYTLFNKSDNFRVPDTRVSRTGVVNQVNWSSSSATAAVEEHALEELVPKVDQVVAAAYGAGMPDPKLLAAQQVTELMDLAHESRVAALFFTPGNYATANKTTLSGTAQWSDYTNSDPFTALVTAVQNMTFSSVQPNTLLISQLVWNVLRRHPKLVLAAYGTLGGSNFITLDFLAQQLGLDRIIVGSSKVDTSKEGQSANLQPIWGKSAALFYQPSTASTTSPAFAITAQFGTRVASEHFDIDKGWRGSDVVRVGEAIKELVIAPDYGYLFQNVIA